MKLKKKLSTKQFVVSHLFILIFGLLFIFGLYYIVNIQYQKPSNPFLRGPVTTLPKTLRLDLSHPDDESLVFNSPILISGQTNPQSEVLIFTDSENLIVKSKNDGSFSESLALDEGENQITAVVFDQTGDSRIIKRTVFYSKEKI